MKNKFLAYLKVKYLLRKKDLTFKILIALPFLLILGLFFLNQTLNQRENAQMQEEYQQIIESNQFFIEDYPQYADPEFPNTNQVMLDSAQKLVEKFEAYHIGTPQERLLVETEELGKYYSVALKTPKIYDDQEVANYGYYPALFVDGKLVVNHYLIEHNLYLATDSVRYGTNTATFLMSISRILLGIGGIFYLMLCFGFSNLRANEENKYRLFAVQPLKRWQIFLWDFLAFVVNSLVYLLLLLGFAYLVAFIFGEQASMLYPVLTSFGTTVGSLFVLPLWQYLLLTCTLFLLSLTFFYLVCQIIFCFIRKSFVSIFLTLLLFSYFLLSGQMTLPQSFQKVQAYSPTSYLDASAIFIGQSNEDQQLISTAYSNSDFETDSYVTDSSDFPAQNISYYMVANSARLTKNTGINWQNGLLSLAITNCLCYGVAFGIYKKKMCS